jgi:haloalkane dehalogenase
MGAWLVANDLSEITFFGQDWGGLIGLRLVVDHPARFARVVIGNTALPINTNSNPELVAKIAQFRSDGQRPESSRDVARLIAPAASRF